MNTKIVSLMAIMMAVLAVPAFAATDIRVAINTNGLTSINEYTSVGGYDWSEARGQRWQDTAYIHEGVMNDGSLMFVKEVFNPTQWMLSESKQMEGSGLTSITKQVSWWTEDSHVVEGVMKYPTVASIYTYFETNTLTDIEEVHNVADSTVTDPKYPGEFSHSMFLKNWDTDDDFKFVEGVSINMELDCEPELPETIPLPTCECQEKPTDCGCEQ